MIILGLGSNKGDRLAHLRDAVRVLGGIVDNLVCSPIYESRALLPDEAPKEWDIDFLNMAVCGETKLTAHEFLERAKQIEKELGRKPSGHWGPREIDIDILAYDDAVIHEPHLVVPHQYMLERDFALIPVADIAPEWRYPVRGELHGMSAKQLAGNLISSMKKTSFTI
ncbi:MAG TPA: 2-amino-4-hydroxy-6-hydroxymethyldihydropteridine diphosphokinase [Rickettsiales bacterium]|nr:2-amino-4-hydroxy-6-hydroxymethyldihydropteridine diphosphokinase [Rickettsiales bacterium]